MSADLKMSTVRRSVLRAWPAAVCAALTMLSLLVLSGCGSAEDVPSSRDSSDDGGADNSKLADRGLS